MVGDAAPAWAVMDVRAAHPKAAHVDPVEPEQRQHRRKAAGGVSFHELEYFVHVERMRELLGRLMAPVPVVEVARDDQRCVCRHQTLDALAQALELAAAAARRERKVYADTVKGHV